jgi:hypothetical protein
MLALLENLRHWWHSRDGKSDLRALAGKWPDTAQWMARLAAQTRDPGPLGRNGAQLAARPKCDAGRGR